jgi:serine/threonine protein kinase
MLVDRDFSIRVADFGMSRQRRKAMLSAKNQGGTAEWTAPEVLRGLPYHEKADVFSFGVVLHELMTQSVPWNDLSSIQAPPPPPSPTFSRPRSRLAGMQ